MLGGDRTEKQVEHALRTALPATFFYAAVRFAFGGPVGDAVVSGVIFGVLFGASMAVVIWRRWEGAGSLSPTQRVAVAAAVRRGHEVSDAELARGVVQYADSVRRAEQRNSDHRWLLALFALATIGLAVANTANGSVRSAVVWWAFTALWIGLLWSEPRRRERLLARAQRAELAARRVLDRDASAEPSAG